jgi:hypothetical protein
MRAATEVQVDQPQRRFTRGLRPTV